MILDPEDDACPRAIGLQLVGSTDETVVLCATDGQPDESSFRSKEPAHAGTWLLPTPAAGGIEVLLEEAPALEGAAATDAAVTPAGSEADTSTFGVLRPHHVFVGSAEISGSPAVDGAVVTAWNQDGVALGSTTIGASSGVIDFEIGKGDILFVVTGAPAGASYTKWEGSPAPASEVLASIENAVVPWHFTGTTWTFYGPSVATASWRLDVNPADALTMMFTVGGANCAGAYDVSLGSLTNIALQCER